MQAFANNFVPLAFGFYNGLFFTTRILEGNSAAVGNTLIVAGTIMMLSSCQLMLLSGQCSLAQEQEKVKNKIQSMESVLTGVLCGSLSYAPLFLLINKSL